MKRIVAGGLVLGSIGLASLVGATQASAEAGLALETTTTAGSSAEDAEDAIIDAQDAITGAVSGSSNTISKTLSSLSGAVGGAMGGGQQPYPY
ncbi:hypothetical protein DFR70_105279 [Nocardia tenerifensis]|uniref:Secreted protein n=1 Tax=Nocardia tenerifensis TaxID=228006 RepID=A0A318K108_9NOCA|nr:hypothetical protein [Nocardia tenerifensis]PXX64097.1 hypothetical protein DFR70_105279 [Nocardia tenerifensis]